jgi:glutamine amidotransferase
MLTIIDYGMGNVGSIINMVKKAGFKSEVTSDVNTIKAANKIILPGVGSFDRAIENLESLKIKDIIIEKAFSGTPILGICLGMQLLAESSEEGTLPGLGLIPGKVTKFYLQSPLKVPHMGWNSVNYSSGCPLFKGFDDFEETRFYFVHSFYFKCTSSDHEAGVTSHGFPFTSCVQRNNVFGVQFHPEKSHKFGLKLFNNFINYVGS